VRALLIPAEGREGSINPLRGSKPSTVYYAAEERHNPTLDTRRDGPGAPRGTSGSVPLAPGDSQTLANLLPAALWWGTPRPHPARGERRDRRALPPSDLMVTVADTHPAVSCGMPKRRLACFVSFPRPGPPS